MKPLIYPCALFAFSFLVTEIVSKADEPGFSPPTLDISTSQVQPAPGLAQPIEPKKTPVEEKLAVTTPLADLFAQTPQTGGGELTQGYNPQMIGYFPALYALERISVLTPKATTFFTTGVMGTLPAKINTALSTFVDSRTFRVPVATYGAFNIADNESPRPEDRVYITYNNFGDLRGPVSPGRPTLITAPASPLVGTTVATRVATFPGALQASENLNREVFGFEKTFLDGRASVEVRLPLLQQAGTEGISSEYVGDVTIIGKYAFLLDRTTGNVWSGGLAVTAPTGSGIETVDGNVHSALLQPFTGYILNWDRFYVMGFHAVVVPTDARDQTFFTNDVALSYWLYRACPDRFLSYIVPTVEAHVTTPLNHMGSTDPLTTPDLTALTTGVHFGFYKNSTLTFGVSTPLTGPQPYRVEGIVQFNWRF